MAGGGGVSNPLDTIDQAADYVAKLAAIEHAYITDDEDTLSYLLGDVDPIDVRHTANLLKTLAANLRGGPTELPAPTTPVPTPPGTEQATAPLYSVTHVGDNWSKRVPCS